MTATYYLVRRHNTDKFEYVKFVDNGDFVTNCVVLHGSMKKDYNGEWATATPQSIIRTGNRPALRVVWDDSIGDGYVRDDSVKEMIK